MEKQRMTLHRALSELKLIDSKIEKQISELESVGIYQKGKKVYGTKTTEEFDKYTKAKFQSITDMIERRLKIKAAVMAKNAETEVIIAGNKMTIVDAINYKSIIVIKNRLANELNHQRKTVCSRMNMENEKLNKIALDNAKVMLGKEGDAKPTDEDVKNIMEPFIERNKFNLCDPLNSEKIAEELHKDIEDFKSEVDAVLSEANATTFIEI